MNVGYVSFFLLHSFRRLRLARYKPTLGCPTWCQVPPLDVVLAPHLDFNVPVRSLVRSFKYIIHPANDRIFHLGSLFKLLGVEHNQTLPAIRIQYRSSHYTSVTLAGTFNTITDTSKMRKDGYKSRGDFEKLRSRNVLQPDYNSFWRVILLAIIRRSTTLYQETCLHCHSLHNIPSLSLQNFIIGCAKCVIRKCHIYCNENTEQC